MRKSVHTDSSFLHALSLRFSTILKNFSVKTAVKLELSGFSGRQTFCFVLFLCVWHRHRVLKNMLGVYILYIN